MAGFTVKKRSRDEFARPKGRPFKKSKKQPKYHSSDSNDDADEDDKGEDFPAVNLLDSDGEDLENMVVDDGPSSGSNSSFEDDGPSRPTSKMPKNSNAGQKPRKPPRDNDDVVGDQDEGKSDGEDSNDDDNEDDDDDDASSASGEDGGGLHRRRKPTSKRNDPAAFATSMSKILATKLSSTRRADPVLSRSSAAHEASRAAVDGALEARARRKLAEQRRAALDKGRVRDVLLATNLPAVAAVGGEGVADGGVLVATTATTTSELLESERRLRKVAQRGVIKLFNAVRAAQVKAAEAERANRADGVIGMGRREERVAEMSKKGFLDLIAAGGGGLKKGPLEEA